jgi:ribonuclease P protein component
VAVQHALIEGFLTRVSRDETHLSAIGRQTEAHSRVSRSHEIGRRPQGVARQARQGSCPAGRLSSHGSYIGSILRHRLRGASEFGDIFRSGRRLDGPFLQVIVRRATGTAGRLGFVVSSKLLARAVDRNRVRRVVREAVRLRRPQIEAYDLIVRLRRAPSRLRGRELYQEISMLLDSLTGCRE